MRIVHVDSGRELRGGQHQLLLLARGLAARGHEQVILARHGSPLQAACRDRGFETLPLKAWNLVTQAGRSDLVHAHDARAHTLAALGTGTQAFVVSRRVAFPVSPGALSRWKYARPRRFLAVSEFVRGRLLEAGVPEGNISVVYDGVEIPASAPAAARDRVVIAPATHDPQKGSALAAEACRAAGIELKFSQDLARDLPHATAFLYLSYSEGLGSAILLAMACRTPVIASAVDGIPEIVEHGRTGLLVENQPAEAAAAIRTVLDEPAAAAQRAEAAYAQVAARFTDAIMVAQTEQAYLEALGRLVP